MKNIMVDIETLGTKPGCIVLSIGAVEFDGGELGREFYVKINPVSSQAVGLKIDADSLVWWMRQRIKPPVDGTIGLIQACQKFSEWLRYPVKSRLWANSPSFDAIILEENYRRIGFEPPWSFRYWRDFRTARELLAPDFDLKSVPRQGDAHNALSDAKWQATALMMMGYDSKTNI